MDKAALDLRQLRRLETLIDVIYGIIIWRLFTKLPQMEDHPSLKTIGHFLAQNRFEFALITIAVLIVVVFWMQNNMLFKHLVRTDDTHITLAIMQIFTLMLFLYAMGAGIDMEGDALAKLLESVMACLMGVLAYISWRYSIGKGKLIDPDFPAAEKKAISTRILAEPATAAATIPFALFLTGLWDLSWFFYPLFAFILSKRRKARHARETKSGN